MVAHLVFALINEGVVKNTVVGEYYDCDQAAKATYGNSAFAVEITQIPTQIGDTYDGSFHRVVDGETNEIRPVPTESAQIATLTESLNNIELALVELYEGA